MTTISLWENPLWTWLLRCSLLCILYLFVRYSPGLCRMGLVFFIVVNAPLCFLVSFFSSSRIPDRFFLLYSFFIITSPGSLWLVFFRRTPFGILFLLSACSIPGAMAMLCQWLSTLSRFFFSFCCFVLCFLLQRTGECRFLQVSCPCPFYFRSHGRGKILPILILMGIARFLTGMIIVWIYSFYCLVVALQTHDWCAVKIIICNKARREGRRENFSIVTSRWFSGNGVFAWGDGMLDVFWIEFLLT